MILKPQIRRLLQIKLKTLLLDFQALNSVLQPLPRRILNLTDYKDLKHLLIDWLGQSDIHHLVDTGQCWDNDKSLDKSLNKTLN